MLIGALREVAKTRPVGIAALALCLSFALNAACAVEYVSVGESSAVLFDAPSLMAKKRFIVNRYMPFERVVTLDNWVKVRDRSGGLYWLEKRVLSDKSYVVVVNSLVDVLASPDPASARLFQVRQDVAMELLEVSAEGWLKVRHKDGETGFLRRTEVWGM